MKDSMQHNEPVRQAQQYAESELSDKAFRNMLIWFSIYAGLFCIGVIIAINADKINMG